MKLKSLAAAAAVLCSASAFASINTNDADAELFLVVWDEAQATYVLDTGLTLGELTSQASAKSWSYGVAGDNWNKYVAADGNLADFQDFEGTRWALWAVDTAETFAGTGDDRNLVTTRFKNQPVPTDASVVDQTQSSGIPSFIFEQSASGLGFDTTKNLDSVNLRGTPAHFIEGNFSAWASGNAIGNALINVNVCTWDLGFDPIPCSSKNGAGLRLETMFDGKALSVSAVPEPGTYALLIAGLATVGLVARRRKA
jgi:hypothetical protein